MVYSSVSIEPNSSSVITPHAISVLVVEDDFGDYDNVARSLKKMRYFVATCMRAKTIEAARLALSEKTFDVVLIDYNLGSESGARLLKEMGGRESRGVAILLTGLLDEQVHFIALQAGAITCIAKNDLSPTLLETTIRSALYTHQLEAEISGLLKALAQKSAGSPSAHTLNEYVAGRPEIARLLGRAEATAA